MPTWHVSTKRPWRLHLADAKAGNSVTQYQLNITTPPSTIRITHNLGTRNVLCSPGGLTYQIYDENTIIVDGLDSSRSYSIQIHT